MKSRIPFNRPYLTGKEYDFIQDAIDRAHTSGNGWYTQQCEAALEAMTGARRALLVPSCTAALEMSSLLLDLGPGDEVIMPSFTFVSTANAFALRGATPVFVDIREDTLNIDPEAVEEAVGPNTKAIVPVHYAGVGADMDAILDTADTHGLDVVEDAAQALLASTDGKPLGSFGRMGTLSFHETKNVVCGEGGALLINDESLVERAEVIREKGTNRTQFFRGEVDKYTWVDVGSSFLLSDLSAAYLLAQLNEADTITALRRHAWDRYYDAFEDLEQRGVVRRPIVPAGSDHNAQIFHLILEDLDTRTRVIESLADQSIAAVFHYVPLHTSPAGRRLGRAHGSLETTEAASDRLVRLPLWSGMSDDVVDEVVDAVHAVLT